MKIDYSAAELFLAYLDGQASTQQVYDHPAYQAVCRHAARYADGLAPTDIEKARQGHPSPFYGLEQVDARLVQVSSLLQAIRSHQDQWIELASQALAQLAPDEALEPITIYPIIGYDMGIGLEETVCMNLNTHSYLEMPQEFLYYMIHECVHILYERRHTTPTLQEMLAGKEWDAYFMLWTQNEGFAVYAPLALRTKRGHLQDRDYRVLCDSEALQKHFQEFLYDLEKLQDPGLEPELALEIIFGSKRLTYRAGAGLIRKVELQHGIAAVREAFQMSAGDFMHQFLPLLRGPNG